ncbi:MAG: GNAT family N-acetyltransferase [Thioalkalispiraceae bacterium]|jgi:GNAT superfamily N-acetyltransferase
MIELANSEAKLRDCFPVILQLRPHLELNTFIEQVAVQAMAGYQIAGLTADDHVVAVAGFRITHSLAWGRFLYVDDLVTDIDQRSKGYGKQLLHWLIDYAKQNECIELHLDSGLQRIDAHRFYEREGMIKTGYHYSLAL